ncbi:hypothetical protein CR513_03396, partial [Mucuna pruriens]
MVNFVGDKEEGEKPTLFLNDDKRLWYLINGESNHMCGYKENFWSLKRRCKEGDSYKVQIQGKKGYETLMKDNYLWLKDQISNLVAKTNLCRRNLRLKLFHVQFICLTTFLQGMSNVKHLKKYGVE